MPPIVPSIMYLFPLNTQVIEVDGLMDEISDDYLNGATVSATLVDAYGNPDAILNGIPMVYVAGSNGNYQGVVPGTFNAALGSGYTLQITAVNGSVQALWSIPAQVKIRVR